MIRSGLVNQKIGQNPEGYPHSRNNHPRDEIIRPYVEQGISTIVQRSSYATPSPQTPQDPTPYRKPNVEIGYDQIFGRTLTPDERMYMYNLVNTERRFGKVIGKINPAMSPMIGNQGPFTNLPTPENVGLPPTRPTPENPGLPPTMPTPENPVPPTRPQSDTSYYPASSNSDGFPPSPFTAPVVSYPILSTELAASDTFYNQPGTVLNNYDSKADVQMDVVKNDVSLVDRTSGYLNNFGKRVLDMVGDPFENVGEDLGGVAKKVGQGLKIGSNQIQDIGRFIQQTDTTEFKKFLASSVEAAKTHKAEVQEYLNLISEFQGKATGRVSNQMLKSLEKMKRALSKMLHATPNRQPRIEYNPRVQMEQVVNEYSEQNPPVHQNHQVQTERVVRAWVQDNGIGPRRRSDHSTVTTSSDDVQVIRETIIIPDDPPVQTTPVTPPTVTPIVTTTRRNPPRDARPPENSMKVSPSGYSPTEAQAKKIDPNWKQR